MKSVNHASPLMVQTLMHQAATLPLIKDLPEADNTPEGLASLLAADRQYRGHPWPAPFAETTHRLHLGDARDLAWIQDESVHLIVTSPPYWTLKEYEPSDGQMGAIADYERFLDELDRVWRQCARVLVPGGRICCVVGDVCIPRGLRFVGRQRHWRRARQGRLHRTAPRDARDTWMGSASQSRGGDNTKTMAPRFVPEGAPQPNTRYLLPVSPHYVLLGLSGVQTEKALALERADPAMIRP